MGLGGREALAHRIDRGVRAAPFAASREPRGHFLRSLLGAPDDHLFPEGSRITARLAQPMLDLLPGLERAVARIRGEDEAVAEPRCAPVGGLDEAPKPNRDRAPWARVDAGAIDVIEAAVEAHERLAPELAQE